MTDFLFLQRFRAGAVEPLPYEAVLRELGGLGAQRPVEGGTEISTSADEVADLVLMVGDARQGVHCIAFVGPAYDDALRTIVLRCLQNLDCVAFDDALTRAYVSSRGAERPLPAGLAEATATVLRRVSHAVQLWPDWIEPALERGFRYAVVAGAEGDGEALVQYFDAKDPGQDIFEISVATRPDAWNAGTVAAFRMLQARVDRVRDAHPGYGVAYRYTDTETPLREAEFGRGTAPLRHPITLISPWPGPACTPPFAADRELFASFSSQGAAATRTAQEEFGLALDGSAASVDTLAALLDRLHEDVARHGFQRQHMLWVVRAGSYLSLLTARGIGGQLGFTTTSRARVLCVRMHSGRLQFPVLRVLDHVVNGSSDSVRGWFAETARVDASRTPRDADWVCNIPGYCDILLGRADLKGGVLPLAGKIPRERLDFSVESLHALDGYLAQVRSDAAVPAAALGSLIIVAGAYLGEVIRSAQREVWLWVPYDDYAAANPEFSERRPRQSALMAFLDSPEQCCYPLVHVAAVLAGQEASCHRFALEALRPEEPEQSASAGAAVAAAPQEEPGEPAFCPNCGQPLRSTALSCKQCGADFSADHGWKPEKTPPAPKAEPVKPQEPRAPAKGPGVPTRWVLRAAHVCLLAPILHFVFVAVGNMAPIAGITRLWTFAFLFYATGGLLAWRDKRRRLRGDGGGPS